MKCAKLILITLPCFNCVYKGKSVQWGNQQLRSKVKLLPYLVVFPLRPASACLLLVEGLSADRRRGARSAASLQEETETRWVIWRSEIHNDSCFPLIVTNIQIIHRVPFHTVKVSAMLFQPPRYELWPGVLLEIIPERCFGLQTPAALNPVVFWAHFN